MNRKLLQLEDENVIAGGIFGDLLSLGRNTTSTFGFQAGEPAVVAKCDEESQVKKAA